MIKVSTFYPSEDDVRKRVYVYLTPDEREKLNRYAEIRRRPKSAAAREGLMALIDMELKRYEMHQAITDLVSAELKQA